MLYHAACGRHRLRLLDHAARTRRRPAHHAARLGLLYLLDILRILRRRFRHVDRASANQRTARCGSGQFHNGHPNRHMQNSLRFPVRSAVVNP